MSVTQAALATETSDYARYFDQWWHDLKVSLGALAAGESESDESLRMPIESLPGSN